MSLQMKILFYSLMFLAFIFLCSTPSHAMHYEKAELKVEVEIEYLKVKITKYGSTGNSMANGEWPYVGAVAISDRSIPFGTRIIINGENYVVKDRTADWIQNKNGLTIDIYSEESNEDMLHFGKQTLLVGFYK